jgi:hypothetical protein
LVLVVDSVQIFDLYVLRMEVESESLPVKVTLSCCSWAVVCAVGLWQGVSLSLLLVFAPAAMWLLCTVVCSSVFVVWASASFLPFSGVFG